MAGISGSRILDSIRKELNWRGFSFLDQFRPEISTHEIADELGTLDDVIGISAVQRINPKKKEGKAFNTYSGNFGLQEFPLHTDLAHWYIPPRYLILRCVVPSPNVYTTLLDFSDALVDFSENIIVRAQFFPRRKVSNKRILLRFFQTVNGKNLFRWDSLFIVPANREAEEVSSHLTELEVATKKISFGHSCDTLIIDNWRMLHGRTAVFNNSLGRQVERVYLREIH